MSFAIATLEIDGQAAPALLLDGRFWPAAGSALVAGLELPGETVLDWLRHWDVALERLRRLAAAIEGGLSGVTPIAREAAVLLAPVRPAKLFCIGANYTDHLEEMGVPRHLHPDPAINPYFFLKPGSTAVVGAGDTVFMPARCTLFDWEAEAAVVFGKGGRNISGADAMSHVAGYTLAIDFTARNQMSIPDHPLRWDLTLGKCQDAMTPIGPVLVPAEFVDGDDFHFSLSVNGVRKQAASTAGMIHSIAPPDRDRQRGHHHRAG